MGKIWIFGIVMVLAMASGMAFAASVSEPILQISSYSTVPTEVYSGTLGYLQITLVNSGTDTAQSVTVHYTLDGSDNTLSSGEISAGSSAQLSIPFKIRPESAGSIQTVGVDVYYTYQSASGISNKKTSLSIPLTVLQQKPLVARTTSIGKSSIAPGEGISLSLELKNTGGVINNLVITLPSNSSFSLDGTTQLPVGTIPSNSSINMSLSLLASSSTQVGTYSIPVVFTYRDALNRPYDETLYVGPVSVLSASTQYRVYLEPLTPSEIGSQAKFSLTLENAGTVPVSATIDINSTGVFTPIGVQRLYFDSVAPGAKASKSVTLGISPSQSAGYYTLPLTVTQSTGQSSVSNAGIAVSATPEITVSLESQSGTQQIQISNTGNSQIRSVYASARAAGSQSSTESFLGTMNVDDFATLSIPPSASGNPFQSNEIEVTIRFKDGTNTEHVLNETLKAGTSVSGGNSTGPSGSRSGASGTGGFAGRQAAGPLGFLFGGNRNAAAVPSGSPDLLTIGIAAVVIVAGGYAFYRFYWLKRKAKGAGAPPKK